MIPYGTQQLIDLALAEDIGPADITTQNLIPESARGTAAIIAKESLVMAGLAVARAVFERLDPGVRFSAEVSDGDRLFAGKRAVRLEGTLSALLMAERVALNFLQRLCGIATLTRSYADALDREKAVLTDTRKTTPGWRALEKYAVRVGGGANHRMGLYDGVLIKDNHIAAAGGIEAAVAAVRPRVSHLVKIEVEVTCMEEVQAALAAGADVIMLDNMDIPQIQEAVAAIQGRALVEVSGGITRERLAELARTGADIISCGAVTHSARSMDLSMKIMG